MGFKPLVFAVVSAGPCARNPPTSPCAPDGGRGLIQVLSGSFAFGDDAFGRWTAAGDFDGDGLADLAVGVRKAENYHAGSVRLFRGNGVAFDTPSWFEVPGASDLLVSPGDVTGDGIDDLVIGREEEPDPATWSGTGEPPEGAVVISLWSGSPMGPARTRTWSYTGGTWMNPGFALADMDGDGVRDLVVALGEFSSEELGVFLSGPGGPSQGVSVRVPLPRLERYVEDDAATVGDLDGDGDEEVVFGSFLVTGGDLQVSRTPDFPGTEDSSPSLAFGDLNGDRVDDLVVGEWTDGQHDGVVSWYPGGPRGIAANPGFELRGTDGEQLVEAVAIGDLDRDGFAELVVGAREAGRIAIHPGGPDGPSSTPLVELTGGSCYVGDPLIAVPDLDGRGLPDLIAPVDGSVLVYAIEDVL